MDYYHFGIKIENTPGIVKELFIASQPEQMSGFYYCLMICFRSVCLSVATMFTFGDISIVNAQFGWATGISTSNNEGPENDVQNAESCCTASHTGGESAKFNTEQHITTQCEGVVGDTGFEPVTSRV